MCRRHAADVCPERAIAETQRNDALRLRGTRTAQRPQRFSLGSRERPQRVAWGRRAALEEWMRPGASPERPSENHADGAREDAQIWAHRPWRRRADRILAVDAADRCAEQPLGPLESLCHDADEREAGTDQVAERRLAAGCVE